ncbi:hypothetical protein G6L40_23250 [Rhizobium lusitanum]|nr:hypothetical protein [Rhizobium lusitanum]
MELPLAPGEMVKTGRYDAIVCAVFVVDRGSMIPPWSALTTCPYSDCILDDPKQSRKSAFRVVTFRSFRPLKRQGGARRVSDRKMRSDARVSYCFNYNFPCRKTGGPAKLARNLLGL